MNPKVVEGTKGYIFAIELVSRFLMGLEEINAEVAVSVKLKILLDFNLAFLSIFELNSNFCQ